MKDVGHVATDKELARLERELSKIYNQANKELQTKLESQLSKLKEWEKENKQVKIDNVEEYNNKRRNKLFEIDRKKKIINNLAEEITTVNQKAMNILNDTNSNIYAINHNWSFKSINDQLEDFDITYDIYNKNIVKGLLNDNPTLFPKRKMNIPKDLQWNMKNIQSELIQGLIQGKSVQKIAKDMQTITDMNKNSAIRNARTTVTSVENRARQDSRDFANKKMGIITQKEWVSAIDTRTRETHSLANGQLKEYDKPFEIGKDKLMYPGDLVGSAENIYNCRCSSIDKVVDFDYNKVKEYINGNTSTLSSNNNSNNKLDTTHKIINNIGNVTKEKAYKELAKYEKEIVKQDYETAVIIAQNGNVYRVDGQKSSVNITDIGIDKLKNAYITHNHPKNETEYSFSKEDIRLYEEYKLKVLRGADNKYAYELTEGKTVSKNIDLLDIEFENYMHNIVTDYCSKNNIKYKRWKND